MDSSCDLLGIDVPKSLSVKTLKLYPLAFLAMAAAAGEQYLPFPPRQIGDLIGRSVCEIPPESEVGMYRLPIPESTYRLEFRKRYQFEVVLLVAHGGAI